MAESEPSIERYQRQFSFAPLGEPGQRALLGGRVLICGCGALGSAIANTLVRAGVGYVRIVDRDFLELSNLQRQVLFDEQDVAAGLPKAIAAAEKLRRINSEVIIEPIVADVTYTNIESLVEDVDLVLDGTDNFETRYLVNDVALKRNIPWVYGGCLGAEGQSMSILPGRGPCLRCLMPEPPPVGMVPTCDTAGILASIIYLIAAIQATEGMKILCRQWDAVSRMLTVVDLWDNRLRQVALTSLDDRSACPTCSGREYPWLAGARVSRFAVLCGRNSVQLSFPDQARPLDLDALAHKLAAIGKVQHNPFLVRCQIDGYVLTVFPDGRAIVGGTEDVGEARVVYAKYVGN